MKVPTKILWKKELFRLNITGQNILFTDKARTNGLTKIVLSLIKLELL